jgi:hypothetical protein
MPPELWFGPNIGSIDLLDLFRYPEKWETARHNIRMFQLYAQHIYLDQELPAAMNGPNHWPALCGVKAFDRLKEWGLELSIEMGAVKWDPNNPKGCTAEANETTALTVVIKRITDAGGRIGAIAIDEALDSGLSRKPGFGRGLTLEKTVEYTARFMQNLKPAVPAIGVIEPYPDLTAALIIKFMEGLQQAGQSPAFLHLDVDRYGIRDHKILDKQVAKDLGSLQYHCGKWGIPFGVVLWGQRFHDEAEYHTDVLRWVEQLHRWLDRWPDRLIVQSWEEIQHTNLKTLPHNVPDNEPLSHTRLICEVQERVARA